MPRTLRILTLLLPLLVVGYLVSSLIAHPRPAHPFFEGRSGVSVIAHQGGDGLWPSSTMLAFEGATRLGVDLLEFDVHASRDGVLVVIHDDTVDRTTDGSGAVADLTLAQLQTLDAGHG